MPVFPEVYTDAEVLEANPWFEDALPVVETARSRPVTPAYPRVSEVIRTNMNAFLAGTQDGPASLQAIEQGLSEVMQ